MRPSTKDFSNGVLKAPAAIAEGLRPSSLLGPHNEAEVSRPSIKHSVPFHDVCHPAVIAETNNSASLTQLGAKEALRWNQTILQVSDIAEAVARASAGESGLRLTSLP
jgi:hypothetical protein